MTNKRNIKHVWIMHQVNCRRAFGSGFAQQIAEAFPEARRHYRQHASQRMFGRYLISDVAKNVHIVHIFGQMDYGNSRETGKRYTDYRALYKALSGFANHLRNVLRNSNPAEHCLIYPQYMSCGLAGGNPQVVSQIINHVFNGFAVPRKYINFRKLKEFAVPSEKPLTVPASQEKKVNKLTNYAIIDHIGSLDSKATVQKAYSIAYSLVPEGREAYTLKKVCFTVNPNVKELKKMKNAMRMQKNPEQVVLITANMYSARWALRQWMERVNDITVINFENPESYEVLTLKDIDPTLTKQWEVHPETLRKRLCADIWADALGYTFSAPIFPGELDISVDMHTRRPNLDPSIDKDTDWKVGTRNRYFDDKKQIWKEDIVYEVDNRPEWKSHRTGIAKPTTRPEKFRRYKVIATDAEIDEFYQFYKFLWANKCLEEFLVEDYSICPHCGRPVYNKTEDDRCTYCDTQNPNNIGEIIRYFDTEELDEDEDGYEFYDMPSSDDFEENLYFDMEDIDESAF